MISSRRAHGSQTGGPAGMNPRAEITAPVARRSGEEPSIRSRQRALVGVGVCRVSACFVVGFRLGRHDVERWVALLEYAQERLEDVRVAGDIDAGA